MTVSVRLLLLDVDGVLTDGTVQLLPSGDEARSVHFRDLDAVSRARRLGLEVAILSGEDTASSRRVGDRFGIDNAVWGAKDKLSALHVLLGNLDIAAQDTCFVGDADRDIETLTAVGTGLAPADATAGARAAADHVLSTPGGRGVIAEAVTWLEQHRSLPQPVTST